MTVIMDKAFVNGKVKYAKDAESGEIGNCYYECGKPVRARCGEINEEHWSHIEGDSIYDIETHNEWHKSYKELHKNNGYEIEKRFGNFIADAYNSRTNTVTEYQHSEMPSQEFRNRNKHHKNEGRNIKWILDYTEQYKNNRVKLTQKIKNNGEKYYSFGIKWQTQSFIEGLFTFNDKFNEDKGIPNVPTYFNIINNYINISKLEIFKENVKNPINVGYDINEYKVVLLNVEGVFKDDDKKIGKYGWGQIILLDKNLKKLSLNEII